MSGGGGTSFSAYSAYMDYVLIGLIGLIELIELIGLIGLINLVVLLSSGLSRISLYAYVSCHGYHIEGSYSIEWRIVALSVFFYNTLHYHQPAPNITNINTNIHHYNNTIIK